jgi:hypothetical protein
MKASTSSLKKVLRISSKIVKDKRSNVKKCHRMISIELEELAICIAPRLGKYLPNPSMALVADIK